MEKALNRQKILLQHLQPISSSASSSQTNESAASPLHASICVAGDSAAYRRKATFGDDVVIVAAYHTVICKVKRGGFKDTLADDLLASVLRALLEKTKLNPTEVGDIVVGTILASGSQRAAECRMAAFYAGFPETVPIRTVNRQCSSGLQAVADVAASIKAGLYDIGIRAGLECMTMDNIGGVRKVNPKAESFAQARVKPSPPTRLYLVLAGPTKLRKVLEERNEWRRDSQPASILAMSLWWAVFREDIRVGILDGTNSEVSFEISHII